MTQIRQRKPLSTGAKALILVFFIGIIAFIVAAIIIPIDLSPISNGFLGFYMSASADLTLAVIHTVGLIAVGILISWVYIKYVGVKVNAPVGVGTGGYNPAPVYPSSNPSQKDTETTIS